MSDGNDQNETKGRLSLRPAARGEAGHTVDAGSVRQSFSHGRSKVVQVEVRKKRGGHGGGAAPAAAAPSAPSPSAALSLRPQGEQRPASSGQRSRGGGNNSPQRALTAAEQATRQRVLAAAAKAEAERREQEKISILSAAEEARRQAEEDAKRQAEEEAARAKAAEEEAAAKAKADAEAAAKAKAEPPAVSAKPAAPAKAPQPSRPAAPAGARPAGTQPARPAAGAAPRATLQLKPGGRTGEEEEEAARGPRRPASPAPRRGAPSAPPKKIGDGNRRSGRIDVQAAIEGEDEKTRSLASVRRQRERERRQAELERLRSDGVKVVRDVILPEVITVQELANRMAAPGRDVVRALMKMGVMATITQAIDADTAELIINEFGHRVRRVSDSDVELGLEGAEDTEADLLPRPPVVTIMGHVDHGKTSLLDALRHTDVAAGEAGGITQHIGAYQIALPSGQAITFLDTPGHEAFTAMRARGAASTDIVVLVVAADDGVMPQTIEAIKHAKAANVPIIVAINKIDRPGADANRVRNELLQHEIVVESMSGDTMDVEVSALKKLNLDKLEEAILLQAEILELKANPNRSAEGAIIESRLDKGRGPVATVLVQKGTLHQGDTVVAGAQWGRVRAMINDKGQQLKEALPSLPVEILGLSGAPTAGEPFVVVENEQRAREITEYRQAKLRERQAAAQTALRGTMEEMLARIQAGAQKEVAVVIKADVQGSAEAIGVVLGKLGNEEVRVRIIYSGVGQITESDVQLAKASDGLIIAFNVRANVQARELAQREDVDIRYYSIIYEVGDDIEKLVKGKLAPVHREKFLGYAEIRQVFNITKTGKVAGCYVTEGVVKRGCGVRLLRDNVVIHQGELSQLKRFKDDVKEVARGYECGLSFAGFQDLREGDVVECYETEIVAP
ncbi:bacterial translation initiation factor 2 (bIF-2) [Acidocella aminolytica 101 = DSM 11237]|jgi:translation initiation factor IF-2|uniref:translation initiation factor IF-2 n=5 Tax=Acidocella aminolytica TaxID=33998 RepID=UPI00091B813A|nr:translation initiation factor IF-2 [Acidocella aminolytica]SHE96874.1 bacterial translation initiation factor 2 (bIF-2) [Acidocella aminolytica 101 = DSM 11237]